MTDTVLGAVVLQRSMICGVTVMDVQSGVYVAMNSICTSVPSCIQLRKPSALSSESHPDRSLTRALAEVQQLSHAAFCTSELDLIIRQGSGEVLSIVISTSAYFYNSTQPLYLCTIKAITSPALISMELRIKRNLAKVLFGKVVISRPSSALL